MRKKNKKVNDPALIERVAALETDMSWVKEKLGDLEDSIKSIDSKTWAILGSIIIGILLTLLTHFI